MIKVKLFLTLVILILSTIFSYSLQNQIHIGKYKIKITAQNKYILKPLNIFQKDEYDIINRSRKYVEKKNKGYSFGFTSKAETLNGRIAMIALAACLVTETLTGEGILQQIGIQAKENQEFFFLIITLVPLYLVARKVSQRFQ